MKGTSGNNVDILCGIVAELEKFLWKPNAGYRVYLHIPTLPISLQEVMRMSL